MADIKKLTTQGILYPKRFIEGRLRKSDKTIDSLKDGEGAVLTVEVPCPQSSVPSRTRSGSRLWTWDYGLWTSDIHSSS